MARKVVKVENLSDAVHDVINNYFDGVTNAANELIATTAGETVQELHNTSPKSDLNHKHYAESWAIKQTAKSKKSNAVVVYNQKPQLTHLLEHGHIKVVHGKVLGFTAARPHIARAEKHAIKKITDGIERIAKQ